MTTIDFSSISILVPLLMAGLLALVLLIHLVRFLHQHWGFTSRR